MTQSPLRRPLRRFLLSTAGTVLGIVLLLFLKPNAYPGPTGTAVSAQAPASPSPSAVSPVPSPVPTPTGASATSPGTPSATPSRTGSPARAAARTPTARQTTAKPTAGYSGTVTGRTIDTKYGPVQVQLKFSGGRITAASAVQAPSETVRSQQISTEAIPKLNQETLAAQSASIDAVSGATYTSEGYIKSLQSALDKAGV